MKHLFSMLQKALLVLVTGLGFTNLRAQNITTTIGTYNSSACSVGDTVVLPVTVNMAPGISVASIGLTIDFDTTKLRALCTGSGASISCVTNLNPAIASGFLSNVTNFSNQSPNPPYTASTRKQFRAVWFNLVPVAFNGLMFNLRFVVVGTGNSVVKWDVTTPGNCEYADEFADLIPNCDFVDGNITCGSTNTGPCVPVTTTITTLGSTSFCQGDSVTLEAVSIPGLLYQWRMNGVDIPGANGTTFLANNTGSYTVLITDAVTCSSLLGPVPVTAVSNSINGNLFASDTLLHCGDSLVLDAGAGFDRYEWSTSDTTQTKTVRYTGWYRCRVFDGPCSVEDSVFVSLIPKFLPFNDTTICSGSRLEINLMSGYYYPKTTEFVDSKYYDYDDFEGGPGSSDDWSERNGVDPQVVSNTSYKGNHSLYFNNGWGRNFEFQTEFGQPYGGYFSADYPFMSMAYKIPSGSFTTMLVHISGFGWRGIAFTQGEQLGCYGPKVGSWNVNDTLVRNNQWHFKTINLHDQLQQSLGSGNYKIESIIFHDACTNTGTQGEMWIDEFMITRHKPNLYQFSWSNGDTTSSISVSPTQTTTYHVTVSNGIHSCTDSVTVNVLTNPLNPNLFASDTLFHCGDSLVLDAGAGFDRYEWSSSDTTQSKIVRRTGWYRCRVFDGLCSVEDSVFVSIISGILSLGQNTVCQGNTLNIFGSNPLLNLHGSIGCLIGRFDTIILNSTQSIQACMDTVKSGTVILLEDGVYNQNIVWPNADRVILSSINGPENCILDGSGLTKSVIYITNTSSQAFVCAGITNIHIRNGYGSFPLFHNSIRFGGGILIDENVRAVVSKCIISQNGVPGNSEYSGGIFVSYGSEAYIYNNTIVDNIGPGIWWRSEVFLDPMTPTGSSAGIEGEAVNNIFAFNGGYGLYVQSGIAINTTQIRNNNSFGNGGQYPSMANWYDSNGPSSYTETGINGNISTDPNFTNRLVENYTLASGSPSIGTGENGINMGYEYDLIIPNSYLWSTGDTTASITVTPTQTTTYYVTVSNGIHSCTDSVTVNVLPNPLNPNLFASDTLLHCGDSLVLDAGAGFDRYDWSTSDTTQNKIVRGTGWYRCRVFDGLCSVEDSVFVSIMDVVVDANDSILCSGSSTLLRAKTNIYQAPLLGDSSNFTIRLTVDMSQYPWPIAPNGMRIGGNFGNVGGLIDGVPMSWWNPTSPECALDYLGNSLWSTEIVFPISALGSNVLFKFVNGNWGNNEGTSNTNLVDYGCGLNDGSGNINRFITLETGLDLIYCYDFCTNCDGSSPIRPQFVASDITFVWSTGDTTASITVAPTQTTTYYVTASNGIHSCTDSLTVNVLPNPLNPNLFASDTLLHCGDSLVLDAGAGFDRYEWSTFDTTRTNTVRGTGWYRCRVFDGLCSVEDSVFVSLNSYRIAQDDTAICIGTAIVLGTISTTVGSPLNLIIPEGSVYQADSVTTILSNQAVTGSRTIEVVQSTDFKIGDLLCITTSQVNSISDSNLAGVYELRRVIGINGQILTIEAPLEHSYPLPQNAVTQVIRVPEFNEVWVEGTLTCKEWDGTTGGILMVRANKITVSNNGRITADAKGFRGGQEVSGWGGGYQGEGPYGVGGRNYEPNGTGGGGGNAEWCHSGQGGGGGGYSNVGGNGIVHCNSCGGGWWFPSGCGASGFGGQVLSNHMGRMLMGSGGGSGGIDGDNPDGGGWGGRGGGVVCLLSAEINSTSNGITSQGGNGHSAPGETGGGGGGSGGAVWHTGGLSVVPQWINVSGGVGGQGYYGGNGSDGVRVQLNTSAFSSLSENLLWSTGDTTASITVSPTQTTTYFVTISNGIHSCTDNVTVNVLPNPLNPNLFPSDTLFHCVDSLVLDAGAGFDRYEWSTSDTTQTITVHSSGWYRCRVFAGACSVEDSVFISIIRGRIEQEDTLLCLGNSLGLNLQSINQNYVLGNNPTPNPWPYPTSYDGGYIHLGQFGAQQVFSISMWVKPGAYQNGISVLLDASHGGSTNWVVQSFGTNTYTWGSMSFSLVADAWQHLMLTYNQGLRKCFINGQLVANTNEMINYGGSPALYLGNWPEGGRRFNGFVDELYISYSILESTNFTPLPSAVPSNASGLGLWRFNEGMGSTSLNELTRGVIDLGSWFWSSQSVQNTSQINWSTGDTTASITVAPTQTTTYYVTVSNGLHSCVDSVTVTVNAISLNSNLFASDTLFHCGDSLLLDAGAGYDRYEWSNSDTTRTIMIGVNGWVQCRVYSGVCFVEDSVYVHILPAGITFRDTTICMGGSVQIGALGSTNHGQSAPTLSLIDQFSMDFDGPFSRSVSTEIGSTYKMIISGVFAVHCDYVGQLDAAFAFNQPNIANHQFTQWNGQSIRPTPDVYNSSHIYEYPNLLATQNVQNFEFTDNPYWDNCGSLNFEIYKYTPFVGYLWSTGDTTASITVAPTQTTTYYVTVSNGLHSCVDSVTVTVIQNINNLISADTIYACSDTVQLIAASGLNGYSWSNGQLGQGIFVFESGWYSCQAQLMNCQFVDSVFVSIINEKILQNDTLIAPGSSVQLTVSGASSNNNLPSFIPVISGAYNIVQAGTNYYIRSYDDVLEYNPNTAALGSLGFASQINVTPPSELLGITPSGELLTGSAWNCIYKRTATTWNSVGLCGFGTGGQGFTVGNNGRIIISKGGFLRSIYYSDNNGDSWTNATNHDVDWNAITRTNSGRLLAVSCCGGTGTKGLLQSDNNGTSWYYSNSSVPLSSARWLSKSSNGDLYLIADDNKLYRSVDEAQTWTFISYLPNMATGGQIEQFGDQLYVTLDNSELYSTSNNGMTWINRTSELNGSNVHRIKRLGRNMFIATSTGVFVYGSPANRTTYLWSNGDTTATIFVNPQQSTTYTVQINNGIHTCVDSVRVDVSSTWVGARMKGRVMYATTAGVPMGQVQVSLLRNNQVVGTTTSDAAGYFDLGLVGDGVYSLDLVNPALWRGVNTTDALVVMRHFTGTMVLSGLRLTAGNVNLRGLVNGQEALRITQRVVRQINQFTSGDWAYGLSPVTVVPGDTVLEVPVAALCYGDVNASFYPGPLARLSGEPLLAAGRLETGSGDSFDWPIYLTEGKSIGAMTLEFLVPEGLEIRGVEIPGHRGHSMNGPVEDWGPSAALASGGGHLLYRQEGDVLRVSWFGLNPLVLEKGAAILRLLVQGKPGAMLRLSPTSELADETATPYGFFRLAAPVPDHDSWQVVLLPNPTATTANLALTLPGEGQLHYTVVDALGREVHRGEQVYTTAGYYEVLLPSQTWASGTYSVSLQWQGRTSTERRMLRLVKSNN